MEILLAVLMSVCTPVEGQGGCDVALVETLDNTRIVTIANKSSGQIIKVSVRKRTGRNSFEVKVISSFK